MSKHKIKHRSCMDCGAVCCTNLAMAIGKPANKAEVKDLKWQLRFDTVKVYIRSHHWYQWVKGRCMYLSDKDLCTIYNERPRICRQHNPPECEKFGKFYDVMLSSPEDLDKYLEKNKKKKKKK